ncbi:mismatch repair protein, putative [Trypanosoma brucei gambiense DAL972]|uniref:Mismatch repair protein, putative n=1 Tax=Trypanosoma brucei gambiense (strain MHOM/CI/86/DAL972) TaxID=679716 RepID=D0A1C4_TRYB9|nr:mismatch repair protein, putative [Trypanosoma brucei gambiense DAL972]CBH15066.1 mismatch repair protein, putative [Trypanosoma brucei gambiense DAL972]|eukprot:XP_011777332.1 mismatch repair protein, putative [Trypanosoma brucei gambiense DAL972]
MRNNFPIPLQYKLGVRYSVPITSMTDDSRQMFSANGAYPTNEDVSALSMPLEDPHSRGNFFTDASAPAAANLFNVLTPTAQQTKRLRGVGRGSSAQTFTRTAAGTLTLSTARRTGTSQGCGDCIMALIDNRAGEVGAAICQLPSLTIIITQYGDSVTYAKTLSFIFSRGPAELLVPETVVGSNFVQTLLRHFNDTTITGVQRRSFDEAQGAHRLLELMSTDEAALEVSNTDRYLCLAAANALVEFLEMTYNYTLLPHTVRVKYLALENYMEVSRLSARALNIIATGTDHLAKFPNQKLDKETTEESGKTGNRKPPVRKTLFRSSRELKKDALFVPLATAINYTITAVGRRLLRSTVLQPLRDPTSIELRYDAVEWLCRDNEALAAIRRSLRLLTGDDLERVISNFSHTPKLATLKTMQRCIDAVVTLWQFLRATTQLLYTLRGLLSKGGTGNAPESEECDDVGDHSNLSSDGVDCSYESQVELHEREGVMEKENFHWPVPPRSSLCSTSEGHRKPPMLLRKLLQTLTTCHMEEICAEIAHYLDESVVHVTGGDGASVGRRPRRTGGAVLQVQQCFAVKSNINGTLDAARHQYSQTIESMFAHAESLKQQYGVGSLRVVYDGVRGYHLCYDSRHERNAPDSIFLQKYSGGKHYALYHSGRAMMDVDVGGDLHGDSQQQRPPFYGSSVLHVETPEPLNTAAQRAAVTKHQVRGRRVTCTTKEMLLLRRGADDVVAEILHTQNGVVHRLIEYLRQRLGKLQAVCDGVAMLDLLIAFATYSRLNACVRPTVLRQGTSFNSSGTYFIEARHPGGLFTANTVQWSDRTNVLLLTGPNASGKTTLLRQVGQLIALAQSGCFVPAREAAIQPCDRIIAHMLCDDLEDAATSSFAREMRELSYLCMNATRESVVLVDELGRRTAAREGMAIAWATVEFLVEKRCRTIFATHYSRLTRLEEGTAGAVKNVHFVVAVEDGAGGSIPVGDDGMVVLVGGTAPLTNVESGSKPASKKSCTLRFEYRLQPGPSHVDCYGLRLASRVGFYASALKLAWELLPLIGGREGGRSHEGAGDEAVAATIDESEIKSFHSAGSPCCVRVADKVVADMAKSPPVVSPSACNKEELSMIGGNRISGNHSEDISVASNSRCLRHTCLEGGAGDLSKMLQLSPCGSSTE